jgi:hypothetical protein
MPEKYEVYIDESGEFEKIDDEESSQLPARVIAAVVIPTALKEMEADIDAALSPLRSKYFPGKRQLHVSELRNSSRDSLRTELREIFLRKMPGAKLAFVYDISELREDPSHSGAQLYRNMLALQLLRTLIFYHPAFETNTEFLCNIAHRRFPYVAKFEDYLAGKGYLKLKDAKSGKTEFSAITEAELMDLMAMVAKTLRFQTERKGRYRVKPYASWVSPFMEMADWASNYIRAEIFSRPARADLHRHLTGLFGEERLLFYGASDFVSPDNVLTLFFQRQMGEFLKKYLEYSASHVNGLACNEILLLKPATEQAYAQLNRTTDPLECENILGLAENFLNNKEFYRLDDVYRLTGLVKTRLDLIADEPPDPVWDALAFRYHDVCVRYCNHTADSVNGKIHREKALKIYDRLSPKDLARARAFHELLNRISIWDANEFAFERGNAALALVKEREEKLTNLLDLGQNQILGKIYGSMGQNFAFAGRHDEAGRYFENAAFHLGRPNTQQTSYRAHLALERMDKARYEAEMAMLFKIPEVKDLETLLALCLDGLPITPFDFHLHLILKGMLAFACDTHVERMQALKIFEATAAWLDKFKENHPWELIWVSLGRLLWRSGQKENARRCWKAAAGFTKNPNKFTFVFIGHSARAWEALSWLDERNPTQARRAMDPVVQNFARLRDEKCSLGIFNPTRAPDESGQVRPGWFDQVGRRLLAEFSNSSPDSLRSLCQEFISRFTYNYW